MGDAARSGPAATQVKISVSPEVARAFKAACAANGVSMAAVLSDCMSRYSGAAARKRGYAPNLSTRRQRRAAAQEAASLLERIRDNEGRYRDNIPENLQGGSAYEAAEQCVAMLDEALDLLGSAYQVP